MKQDLRSSFNSQFSEDKYEKLEEKIQKECNNQVSFRIAETPLFVPKELTKKLIQAGEEILEVLQRPSFLEESERAIPENVRVKNETEKPHFICLDFGICEDENGDLEPQLIELQAFASMFCWMDQLSGSYSEYFSIPSNYSPYFSGLNHSTYLDLLKKTLIGDCPVEKVILLEKKPEEQNTRVDFYLTHKNFGIEVVCLSKLKQDGKRLYYIKDGKRQDIDRIYNRLIFDDLQSQSDFNYSVDLFGELEVEWITHPNWFYRISKFTMPFLRNKFVPETRFLNTIESIPSDLENYVLKPLFSFSGTGVVIDVTKDEINKVKDPENWILQRKVNYAEALKSPVGGVKCEIRLMYLWPSDQEKPTLAMSLGRLSRGKMIGVKYNKDLSWVGSTSCFFEQ